MDYEIGEILKSANIGLSGERISFIHCGHAADAVPGLLEYLEGLDEETLFVNRWTREQLRRLAFVLGNPDVHIAIRSGNGLGVVNRQRLISALGSGLRA